MVRERLCAIETRMQYIQMPFAGILLVVLLKCGVEGAIDRT